MKYLIGGGRPHVIDTERIKTYLTPTEFLDKIQAKRFNGVFAKLREIIPDTRCRELATMVKYILKKQDVFCKVVEGQVIFKKLRVLIRTHEWVMIPGFGLMIDLAITQVNSIDVIKHNFNFSPYIFKPMRSFPYGMEYKSERYIPDEELDIRYQVRIPTNLGEMYLEDVYKLCLGI